MRFALLALVFVAAAAAAPARAEDSIAELNGDVLTLTRSEDIEIKSEELAISQREIKVRYQFLNHSASDQTVIVAFPMPDLVWEGADSQVSAPDPSSPDFLDFHTLVDGREVATKYERRAYTRGVDISARLKAFGVPLAPQSEATYKALDGLPAVAQQQLLKEVIAAPNDFDTTRGWGPHHLVPNWTMKSMFYWTQTFPAGREIVVEHRYRPNVGQTAVSFLNSSPIEPIKFDDYQDRYCIDDFFMADLKTVRGSAASPLSERRIAYALATGANWAAPIGDFRLTIDTGSPGSLVSFCAEGVKKIAPGVFELRRADFTPTQDLRILILYRP